MTQSRPTTDNATPLDSRGEHEAGSLLGNLTYLGLARVAAMVMNLIATTSLARAVGSANYGIIVFAAAFIEYFTLFASFGFDTYMVRAIAADSERREKIVAAALIVRMALAVLVLPVIALFLLIMEFAAPVEIVIAITTISVFFHALGLTGVYAGLQRMQTVAAREFAWAFLNMVAILVLVRTNDDLYLAAVISIATTFFTNATILAGYAREFGLPRFAVPLRDIIAIARESSAFFFYLLLNSLVVNYKFVVLGFTQHEAVTGVFAAAWKLFLLANIPSTLIATVFLPRITSQTTSHGRHDSTNAFMDMMLLCAVPIAIFGSLHGGQLIALLFGGGFQNSTLAVSMLSVSASVVIVNTILSTVLIAVGRSGAPVKAIGLGALTSVAADSLLIRFYGGTGAAAASLIAQIVILATLVAQRPDVGLKHMASFVARCAFGLTAAIALTAFAAHLLGSSAMENPLWLGLTLTLALATLPLFGIDPLEQLRRLARMR